MSDSVRPHRRQPTRLPHPWDSPGKNTGVGCHFLLQGMKVKVKSLSRVRLFATPWTAAHQAPLSMGFSRLECWSGVPLLSPSCMSKLCLFLINGKSLVWFPIFCYLFKPGQQSLIFLVPGTGFVEDHCFMDRGWWGGDSSTLQLL